MFLDSTVTSYPVILLFVWKKFKVPSFEFIKSHEGALGELCYSNLKWKLPVRNLHGGGRGAGCKTSDSKCVTTKVCLVQKTYPPSCEPRCSGIKIILTNLHTSAILLLCDSITFGKDGMLHLHFKRSVLKVYPLWEATKVTFKKASQYKLQISFDLKTSEFKSDFTFSQSWRYAFTDYYNTFGCYFNFTT